MKVNKIISVISLIGLMFSLPNLALAHAKLKGVEVQNINNSSISKTYSQSVKLNYSEGIIAKLSQFKLKNNKGIVIEPIAIQLSEDQKVVTLGLPATKVITGTYKLFWQVVSVDTHKTSGSYTIKFK